MTLRILSIDGGGSRALIPVAILQRLLEKQPHFMDSVDVIAGTSTSGITALILAYAPSPEHGLNTARNLWIQGKKLFAEDSKKLEFDANPEQSLKAIKSSRELWDFGKKILTTNKLRSMSALTGVCAYFSADELETALYDIFGESTMADLHRKVMIPALCLGDENDEHWRPELIHNLDDRFGSMTLVEAALRVAAMPILFPIHNQYADAAMLANNPALSAVSQVLEFNPGKLEDIRVLSIGTGINPLTLQGSDPDLGYAGWLMDHKIPFALMQATIESNSQLTDYQCRQILTLQHYHRLNPQLARAWLMHEHKAQYIVEATDIAEDISIDSTLDWLSVSDWVSSQPTAPKRRKP
jgi:patatin-like phospholipase/acyl hydrolase